jgi:Kef-type K+ transport system membrane component KefB
MRGRGLLVAMVGFTLPFVAGLLTGVLFGHRARPGVVNGLGIWWRKLGLAGTNVNELTGQNLTDLGRAPVIYDCLVEVERA